MFSIANFNQEPHVHGGDIRACDSNCPKGLVGKKIGPRVTVLIAISINESDVPGVPRIFSEPPRRRPKA